MTTKYTPTPLPVKLDVSKSNTAEQLGVHSSHVFPRTIHAGKDIRLQEEMNKLCIDVVRKSLHDFQEADLLELPASGTGDGFERWMRAFHSEYDDGWYARNHIRLLRSFRPIWDDYFGLEPVPVERIGQEEPPTKMRELPDLLG